MKKNLSVVVLIVAAIIVGVAIDRSRHGSSLTNSVSTDQPSPQAPKPAEAVPSPQKQAYLTIPEWGVKVPLSTDISDLYYAFDPSDSRSAHFSTHNFADKYGCKAENIGLHSALQRTSEAPVGPDGQPLPSKRIGSYYFTITGAQSSCLTAPNSDAEKLFAQTDANDLAPALQNLQTAE